MEFSGLKRLLFQKSNWTDDSLKVGAKPRSTNFNLKEQSQEGKSELRSTTKGSPRTWTVEGFGLCPSRDWGDEGRI